MAAMASDEVTLAMEEGSPDLKIFFDREGVSLMTQAKVLRAGVVTMRQFCDRGRLPDRGE